MVGTWTPARQTALEPGLSRLRVVAFVLLALTGCAPRIGDITGSLPTTTENVPISTEAGRAMAAQWKSRYDANPTDKTAALNYALGLRGATQYAQATAVLQGLAIHYPNDKQVLAAYGKSLADSGRLSEAAEVLARAHTPEAPDWSVLSAQGSVADEQGDHTTAQDYYTTALKLVPGEPSILSNLGLSYALSKDLKSAEAMLRQAADHPRADARVRQNLALVLALEGKFDEAEAIQRRDLSPADAASNVKAIRQMIAQSNTWRDLQTLDRDPNAKKRGG